MKTSLILALFGAHGCVMAALVNQMSEAFREKFDSLIRNQSGAMNLMCDTGQVNWFDFAPYKMEGYAYFAFKRPYGSDVDPVGNRIRIIPSDDGKFVYLYDKKLERPVTDRDFGSAILLKHGTLEWVLDERALGKFAVCHRSTKTCLGFVADRPMLVPLGDQDMLELDLWMPPLTNQISEATLKSLASGKIQPRAPDGRRLYLSTGGRPKLSLSDASSTAIPSLFATLAEDGSSFRAVDVASRVVVDTTMIRAFPPLSLRFDEFRLIEVEPSRFLIYQPNTNMVLCVAGANEITLEPFGSSATVLWTLTDDAYTGPKPLYANGDGGIDIPPVDATQNRMSSWFAERLKKQGYAHGIWARTVEPGLTYPLSQGVARLQFGQDETSYRIYDPYTDSTINSSESSIEWVFIERLPGRFSVCSKESELCIGYKGSSTWSFVPLHEAAACTPPMAWNEFLWETEFVPPNLPAQYKAHLADDGVIPPTVAEFYRHRVDHLGSNIMSYDQESIRDYNSYAPPQLTPSPAPVVPGPNGSFSPPQVTPAPTPVNQPVATTIQPISQTNQPVVPGPNGSTAENNKPRVPKSGNNFVNNLPHDDAILSPAAIVGISVGGAVAALVIGFGVYRLVRPSSNAIIPTQSMTALVPGKSQSTISTVQPTMHQRPVMSQKDSNMSLPPVPSAPSL